MCVCVCVASMRICISANVCVSWVYVCVCAVCVRAVDKHVDVIGLTHGLWHKQVGFVECVNGYNLSARSGVICLKANNNGTYTHTHTHTQIHTQYAFLHHTRVQKC